MLKKIISNTLFVLCIILCFNACVEDVDFDQADSLAISPPLELSVIHFVEPASTFVDDFGDELTTVRDSVSIDIFSDEFVVDNLVKADFLFETTNTVNRAYQAQIDFFNDSFELQNSFNFEVGASTNNQDIIVQYIEVFEGQELEALKTTTNLVLAFTLQPSNDGSILDEDSPGELKLKSKASFYLDINISE